MIKQSGFYSAFLGVFLLVLADTALAQSGGGFMSSAASTADSILKGLQWFLFIVAVGIAGFQVFSVMVLKSKTWGDILMWLIGMVILGGIVPFSKAAYEYGQTLNFSF